MTTLRKATEYSSSQLVDIVNGGFADYFVPIKHTTATLDQFIRVNDLDLTLSWVATQNDKLVGISLVGQRKTEQRLAAMAVVPNHRGQRIGRRLIETVVDQAATKKMERLWLEVICQNTAAANLYRQMGFLVVQTLAGFQGTLPSREPIDGLTEIASSVVADAIRRWGWKDLPWQVSAENVERLGASTRCFQLGPAYAAVTPNENETQVTVNAMVVEKFERRKSHGIRLAQGILARWPEASVRVPAYFPEEGFLPFFESIGLVAQEIKQFHMVLEIP